MIAYLICIGVADDMSDLNLSASWSGSDIMFNEGRARSVWAMIYKGNRVCNWMFLKMNLETGEYEVLGDRRRN